jgi:phenylacetate-coenzyme A ligase PaaK-like adenylate-forming protein
MASGAYFSEEIETMERSDLDGLIDERVRYTVQYASLHSPFYRHWFRENRIDPGAIRVHEDLLELPIISGRSIREHQPPVTPEFEFLSADWNSIFSIQETSGTSGTPKGFFLTWDDWKRYAEKYARSFVSQGFGAEDRIVVCASYGMNVGANTMTLAAQRVGMGIIPLGKCSFDSRILRNYRPTAIVGSIFKLLRLGRRLRAEGVKPADIAIDKLVAGGESFADESRRYLAEQWDCPVYNTYVVQKVPCVASARNFPDSMYRKILCTWMYTIRRCRVLSGMESAAGRCSLRCCRSGAGAACSSSITIPRTRPLCCHGSGAGAGGRICGSSTPSGRRRPRGSVRIR